MQRLTKLSTLLSYKRIQNSMISTKGDTDTDVSTMLESVGTNEMPASSSVEEDYTCDRSHTPLDLNGRLLTKCSTGKLMYNVV